MYYSEIAISIDRSILTNKNYNNNNNHILAIIQLYYIIP